MHSTGPVPARIAVIGEAPSSEEERIGVPFIGSSGGLLNSLLSKSGIERASCFLSNIVRDRPPGGDISEWIVERKTPPGVSWKHFNGKWVDARIQRDFNILLEELSEVKPSIIIALGNAALWALTGNSGIQKWRGSRLEWQAPWGKCTIIPSLSVESVLRERSLAPVVLMDLKRARKILEGIQTPRVYSFQINPSFSTARDTLLSLLSKADSSDESLLLSGDLETRLGHIACLGIAWSETEALCIPLLELNKVNPFYWPEEEEVVLTELICRLLAHPRIIWVGQNFLYDCQYFYRFWGVIPPNVWDTMIGHHSIYSNMRKGLGFLSSMYAHDHVYWKDEIKEWEPGVGEKQFWTYNCKDSCITWEIWHEIQGEQASQGVSEHFLFQQSLFHPVLRMMNRGIRVDTSQKILLRESLQKAARERQDALDFMAGHELNPKSPAQLKKFFYEDLKLPGIRSMASDSLTLNSPALELIATRVPPLRRLCQTIAELRSIGVFLSTFVNAELDSDGRMRCSFSIAGPITFRFSSSENAFGSGMNLQNIPTSEKQKVGGKDYIHLPNIRKLFIPDPGYTFFDMDLDRADLQVVVWEAGDNDLKLALRLGIDLHLFNACTLFEIKGIPYDELSENHPNYRNHRESIGAAKRAHAKMGVHATNYGVGDYKLATSLGITQREAGVFRARWFGAHPGIRAWHVRTEQMAAERGYISNRFGARLNVLGRFDLPECLAWLPQSTVAGVINRALVKIDAAEQGGSTSIQLLLQVHDSLAGQFRTEFADAEVSKLRDLAQVEIPYDDPLIIPVGINCSTQSWGHCK